MQQNDVRAIAEKFTESLKEVFQEAVEDIVLFDVEEDVSHAWFSISFKLYNFFNMRFNYDRGRFGSCIDYGIVGMSIPTNYKWFDNNIDYIQYWNEVDEEIKLRIPDKYLNRWGQ